MQMQYEWVKELNCAVTVCDTEGNIIYMNDKSRKTFQKGVDLVGSNLKLCHNPQSWGKILELLSTGGTNSYTISKNGQKKLIYQTAWFDEGKIGGLVELSMVIPEDMPHYNRG